VKHKLILSLLAVVLALSLVMVGCAEEKGKAATFSFGQWSGDWLTIYVPKILMEEELGYTTDIAELSVPAVWTAMAAGETDIWSDSWQPNQEEFKKKYAAEVEELGMIYGRADDCLQGWLVPKWVSEQYGITKVPDVKDPEFAKMFDIDADGIGDILGCDAAWKCAAIIDDQIAAYELGDLYEQKYGAEAMMTAAIEGRMKKNEPVLFYFYTPHPFFVKYPVGDSVVWLDDPKDFWPLAYVYIFANKGWIAENPKAAELLRQVEMSAADIGWAMAEIEERGDDAATLEAIAREWMAQHQAEVDSWVKAVK
jgi:glycine betaine/proline transport system substrate-binding protein